MLYIYVDDKYKGTVHHTNLIQTFVKSIVHGPKRTNRKYVLKYYDMYNCIQIKCYLSHAL